MNYNYNLENFISNPTELDKRIIIYDKNGGFNYSVDPTTISHTYVGNNCLTIKIFNKNDIVLNFATHSIAESALIKFDTIRKMFSSVWSQGSGTSGTSGTSGYGSYGGSARKWITGDDANIYGNWSFDLSTGGTYIETIKICFFDSDNQDCESWIRSFTTNSTIKLEKWGNPEDFGIYTINSIYDPGQFPPSYYLSFAVTPIVENSTNLQITGTSVIISYVQQGSTGTSGFSGSSGTSGSSGVDGNFYGTSGSSGENGLNGSSGVDGNFYGTSGSSGTSGTSGLNGTFGTSGSSGISGTAGTSGASNNNYGLARRWEYLGGAGPPSGKISASNVNFTLVASFGINWTDADNGDSEYLVSNYWNTGGTKLMIQRISNVSDYGVFEITARINVDPYTTYNLTYLGGTGTFVNGESYLIGKI